MTWNVPPVGWCVTCLIAFEKRKPAMGLFKGTSLCEKHLLAVVQPELDAVMQAGTDDEGVFRGVWRHQDDGTICTSYPDSFNFTFTEETLVCRHGRLMVCTKVEEKS